MHYRSRIVISHCTPCVVCTTMDGDELWHARAAITLWKDEGIWHVREGYTLHFPNGTTEWTERDPEQLARADDPQAARGIPCPSPLITDLFAIR